MTKVLTNWRILQEFCTRTLFGLAPWTSDDVNLKREQLSPIHPSPSRQIGSARSGCSCASERLVGHERSTLIFVNRVDDEGSTELVIARKARMDRYKAAEALLQSSSEGAL